MQTSAEKDNLPDRRAASSLEGLSVGDAFGEAMYAEDTSLRSLPAGEWSYTDDTVMASSIVWCLRKFGRINQDKLAQSFAEQYSPGRGYGNAMHDLLLSIRSGSSWTAASKMLYGGAGSMGNGAAMRVAPLGAYYADQINSIPEQAMLSAMVTHAHVDGIAGAIAVALAAAYAWRNEADQRTLDVARRIAEPLPESRVRQQVLMICNVPDNASATLAASILGRGERSLASDTVPFCVWAAFTFIDDYEEALWSTVSVGGDVDTNCAIVGGILGAKCERTHIPSLWKNRREPLPNWIWY
ncbi:MAG TPA: ADP-ribosylglycohydrolase family protein [Candidatus Obscuribacterales bacterium]